MRTRGCQRCSTRRWSELGTTAVVAALARLSSLRLLDVRSLTTASALDLLPLCSELTELHVGIAPSSTLQAGEATRALRGIVQYQGLMALTIRSFQSRETQGAE